MVKELQGLGDRIREGVMNNLERGTRTQHSLGRGMDRVGDRRSMGGPMLSRGR